MISIKKYLSGEPSGKASAAVLDVELPDGLLNFSQGVLEGVQQFAFNGKVEEPLREQVTQLKNGLRSDWTTEESSRALNSFRGILAQKDASLKDEAIRNAVEMQHIFAMLNEAMIVLADGKERSIARLNRIQENLQRASVIEDIVALKSLLAETVRFVKAESGHAQDMTSGELQRF